MTAVSRRAANTLANFGIVLVVTVIGLVGLEYASRVLYPLPPGTAFRDSAGNSIDLVRLGRFLVPNSEFYQISPDFNALSHTGPLGLRAPEPWSPPELVFLGDSFTFGQGLTDEQTFPAIYCEATGENCANLGIPGSGTFSQVDVLERWLGDGGWRPREVKLFVFAMASSLTAGNDLFDNVTEIRAAASLGSPQAAEVESEEDAGGLLRWLLNYRQALRVYSNLVRIVVVQIGPSLRSWISLEASPADLADGVQALNGQLARLDALSQEYGFAYSIYVLHPMQDLMRKSYGETADAIQAAAPESITVIDTAPAMLEDPSQFYFPYDGHFNPDGARAIAQFLLDRIQVGGG